jgi:hypothetical protein
MNDDKTTQGADQSDSASASNERLSLTGAQSISIQPVLFPNGVDFSNEQRQQLLDYYKLVIQNSEQLATRRQSLNSFFLSINSMFMAGIGVISKETIAQAAVPPHHHRNPVVGELFFVIMLCITGLIVCRNWEALIKSYARIVQANAVVTEEMERHLLAAMTTAQQRLHGTDFVSMARVESRIASTFMCLYLIVLLGSGYMAFCLKSNAEEETLTPSPIVQPASSPNMLPGSQR